MTSRRICIACGDFAVPGRSRCKIHGGAAWARQPAARQAAYTSAEYKRNREIVLKRDRWCRLRLPGCTVKSTTVDHVISVAKGGGNGLDNLIGACEHCNRMRGGAEGRATTKRRAAQRRRQRRQ